MVDPLVRSLIARLRILERKVAKFEKSNVIMQSNNTENACEGRNGLREVPEFAGNVLASCFVPHDDKHQQHDSKQTPEQDMFSTKEVEKTDVPETKQIDLDVLDGKVLEKKAAEQVQDVPVTKQSNVPMETIAQEAHAGDGSFDPSLDGEDESCAKDLNSVDSTNRMQNDSEFDDEAPKAEEYEGEDGGMDPLMSRESENDLAVLRARLDGLPNLLHDALKSFGTMRTEDLVPLMSRVTALEDCLAHSSFMAQSPPAHGPAVDAKDLDDIWSSIYELQTRLARLTMTTSNW